MSCSASVDAGPGQTAGLANKEGGTHGAGPNRPNTEYAVICQSIEVTRNRIRSSGDQPSFLLIMGKDFNYTGSGNNS